MWKQWNEKLKLGLGRARKSMLICLLSSQLVDLPARKTITYNSAIYGADTQGSLYDEGFNVSCFKRARACVCVCVCVCVDSSLVGRRRMHTLGGMGFFLLAHDATTSHSMCCCPLLSRQELTANTLPRSHSRAGLERERPALDPGCAEHRRQAPARRQHPVPLLRCVCVCVCMYVCMYVYVCVCA
jgi:hypothetical protein